MWKMKLLKDGEIVAATETHGHGRPLADSVHGQHRRLLERRWEKGGGRVTLMMLREQELFFPVATPGELSQFVTQKLLLEQLLAQPQRDRHAERSKAGRRERQIGLQQAFELEERLVIEHDIVDVVQSGSCGLQAVAERVMREAGIVLLAREALLLGGRDDAAVLDEGGCAVVIECREPENAHSATDLGQNMV